MVNLFSDLQKAKAEQEQVLEHTTPPPSMPKAVIKTDTQKVTQISKRVSKRLSNLPSTEEIETFVFQLRKTPKVRANADIPQEWKKRLDDAAHELGVGRYDLLMYIIADFLGELEPTA